MKAYEFKHKTAHELAGGLYTTESCSVGWKRKNRAYYGYYLPTIAKNTFNARVEKTPRPNGFTTTFGGKDSPPQRTLQHSTPNGPRNLAVS